MSTLKLGTRGSLLARKQSGMVAAELERLHSGLRVEIVTISTTGDVVTDRPLHEVGGKGVFTREIELALIDRRIDVAVHSFKDVPVTMPLVDISSLAFAATPAREDPRDVLVSRWGGGIESLPAGARVGTSSLRRRCQLLAVRTDLTIEPIRGNIDTRIRKIRDGAFDAVILAAAGLNRSGLFDPAVMSFIDDNVMLPAAAQGALVIQCRADDSRARGFVQVLNDNATAACVDLERRVVSELHGDCHSPIAALARISGDRIELRAAVGASGGEAPVIRASATGHFHDTSAVLRRVIDSLLAQGAEKLLGN